MAQRVWGCGLVADLSGEQTLYRTGVGALLSPGFSLSLENKTCEIWELWMQCSPTWSCGVLGGAGQCGVKSGILGC